MFMFIFAFLMSVCLFTFKMSLDQFILFLLFVFYVELDWTEIEAGNNDRSPWHSILFQHL